MAVEKVIQYFGLQRKKIILTKSAQLLSFVGDVYVIGLSFGLMTQAILDLESSAWNEKKTKYMTANKNYGNIFEINGYKFQRDEDFTCNGN